MHAVLDFVLHLDTHLIAFTTSYGAWVYALLFGIIFCETGLVVTPFLPGDSLLFAAGAVAASTGALNTPATFALLAAAAFLGNASNYAIGRRVGARVLDAANRPAWSKRLVRHDHVVKAHRFFEQYGGKAVVLSRFVPIVRTFLPFVAGAATMAPGAFLVYNLVGAVAWVALCLGAGVAFGNVPAIKEHFSLVTLGIVVVSVVPMAIEYWRHRPRRQLG